MSPVEPATNANQPTSSGTQRFVSRAWALTRPYFTSDERALAWALLIAIISLNLGSVYMAVLFNDWNKVFYDALQDKNASVFWEQLARFSYLAVAFIVIAVYKFYLTQRLSMRWRAWMTQHYLQRWLDHQAFYHLELSRFTQTPHAQRTHPDNPDQRIQEDINQFTDLSISLSMGVLNATVTLVSFVGILWGLSGGFSFELAGNSITVPGFMVWMALVYSLAGSVLTQYIGRPQIGLNFAQQRLEADFRHHMVRVREYSEVIALDRGESFERTQLANRFHRLLNNFLQLIQAQKRLVWFTSFFGQAATIFPILVAAPRFFSGAIQLGDLMQISSSFGQVQGAMSWFVDNFSSLATWRATTDRLSSFESALLHAHQQSGTVTYRSNEQFKLQELYITLPHGQQWLHGDQLQLHPGQHIGLCGPSGSGKSSLFRVLAGIWPFATGHVDRAPDSVFMPQRPYFPNGALREALAYPESASRYTDAELVQALERAELAPLTHRLDHAEAWTQTLSGGEQQRLAVARVFLRKPRWIFADEITSALDLPTALRVYERLLAMVREQRGAIVSISHQPEVLALCTHRWTVRPTAPGSDHPYDIDGKGTAAPAT